MFLHIYYFHNISANSKISTEKREEKIRKRKGIKTIDQERRKTEQRKNK
jgi:hypothetical protein